MKNKIAGPTPHIRMNSSIEYNDFGTRCTKNSHISDGKKIKLRH
uniref:Uncharacterized protein n=1 Tax=Anguilla anguilla TaxID=7936 RepID=A0A0E9SFF9_ANGAN